MSNFDPDTGRTQDHPGSCRCPTPHRSSAVNVFVADVNIAAMAGTTRTDRQVGCVALKVEIIELRRVASPRHKPGAGLVGLDVRPALPGEVIRTPEVRNRRNGKNPAGREADVDRPAV